MPVIKLFHALPVDNYIRLERLMFKDAIIRAVTALAAESKRNLKIEAGGGRDARSLFDIAVPPFQTRAK